MLNLSMFNLFLICYDLGMLFDTLDICPIYFAGHVLQVKQKQNALDHVPRQLTIYIFQLVARCLTIVYHIPDDVVSVYDYHRELFVLHR